MLSRENSSGSDELHAPRSRADLFWSFTLLALQGFGGVMAVVQRDLVERKRWLTNEQFLDEWAVAQTLPGPNVVNLALMIGGKAFGAGGAFAALAGLVFFPLVVVLVLATIYADVAHVPAVQGAMKGLGAVAAGLIGGTALRLGSALRTSVMGVTACWLAGAAIFAVVGVLRLPLTYALLAIGPIATGWAYMRLRRAGPSAEGTP